METARFRITNCFFITMKAKLKNKYFFSLHYFQEFWVDPVASETSGGPFPVMYCTILTNLVRHKS